MPNHRRPSVRIGIDLGGTKTEIIAIDGQGLTVARKRIPSPRQDYRATIEAVRDLVLAVEAELGSSGSVGESRVGVGIPGAISRATGLVKNANSTWLIGHPLDRDLSDALGRVVKVENDANCFAASEANDGAAAGADVVFGVILGTGVGGGITVGGRVLSGANAIAGEWGHTPLPTPGDDERPGRACYCGRNGCLETWLSGPSFSRMFEEETGRAWSPKEIAAAAENGDADATAAIERYVDRLARGLAIVINILDPDAIVLGGGLSNIEMLYGRLEAAWTAYVFSDRVDTRLLSPMHGDSSGVRGAAWLWQADE
jgi:fructokinase